MSSSGVRTVYFTAVPLFPDTMAERGPAAMTHSASYAIPEWI
jgi:hypothetical protein